MVGESNLNDLAGKSLLVTGGGSGIGRATCELAAESGARVIVADINQESAESVASAIGGRGICLDVASPDGWRGALDAIESFEGGLDYAYLNAGVVTGLADPADMTDDAYRRILGANVDGVVFGVRACVGLLKASGGAFVVTASVAGLNPFSIDPIYTLTKHAVVGYVRAVAPLLLAQGVRINAICPGIVDTPLVGDARQMLEDNKIPLIPPAKVARSALGSLVGDRSAETIVVMASLPPYVSQPVALEGLFG